MQLDLGLKFLTVADELTKEELQPERESALRVLPVASILDSAPASAVAAPFIRTSCHRIGNTDTTNHREWWGQQPAPSTLSGWGSFDIGLPSRRTSFLVGPTFASIDTWLRVPAHGSSIRRDAHFVDLILPAARRVDLSAYCMTVALWRRIVEWVMSTAGRHAFSGVAWDSSISISPLYQVWRSIWCTPESLQISTGVSSSSGFWNAPNPTAAMNIFYWYVVTIISMVTTYL